MKTHYLSGLIIGLFCLLSSTCGATTGANGINWMTNFEEAVNQSHATQKPILLFFTGSDWCGWCTKLEEEALDTPEFGEEVADQFIFVKLDFPLYSSQDPQVALQNKELQDKYDVRSFPTIIILDGKQHPIGVTGYRPGGGRQYAAHLRKIVNDYSAYRAQMQSLGKHTSSGTDLKALYNKARELGFYHDTLKVIAAGCHSDQEQFFLKEQYRLFADEGHVHDQEAVALRQQLLDSDPNNSKKTHYEVAVIDFEACCEEMEREIYSPDEAVQPLINYIEAFGATDKANLWRLNMIVAQVFLEKGQLAKALKFAQASHHTAPLEIQPEIGRAIANIEAKLLH